MSSIEIKPVDPKIDPYGHLGFIKHPDGSITRIPRVPDSVPANADPGPNLIQVLSKDIPINIENNTWARVYLRRPKPDADLTTKQPLVVYFHGGGFVYGSASNSFMHKFCCGIANETPAVIVSMDYRLAPEHRLPAAYEDGMEALHWIRMANEEWLTKYADFSNCFLVGDSAGGNIAYHVGLRALTCGDNLMPLVIRGLILLHPFFGGVDRSPSEIRLANDIVIPPYVADVAWGLGLPIGADRDHEYSNPILGVKSHLLEEMKDRGWRVIVIGCYGDPLVDREIEFTKMLKEKGVDAVGVFSEGGCHGVEVFNESKAKISLGVVKNFILSV